MHDAKLTANQRLLLAAADLERQGRIPFGANDLVMVAWKSCPVLFGLVGYDAPDSNRVLCGLMGDKGIVRHGYLDRVGPKLYRLTSQGRAEADRLTRGERNGEATRRVLKRVKVSKAVAVELARLTGTTAYRRWVQGLCRQIGFADALAFLRGSSEDAIGTVSLTIMDATKYLNGEGLALFDGRILREKELESLWSCCSYLVKTFARELERHRSGRAVRLGG